MFINYAHRGASAYYPENTMSSFFAAISMHANGIETDIHRTKDGVLILYHDDTLDRVTDSTGYVTDYTYEELLNVKIFNPSHEKVDKILSLEDFLKYFGYRDLVFAIELKQSEVEIQTIDMLESFEMRERSILTSFEFEYLRNVKAYAPMYKIGYLYENDPEAQQKVESIGGEELCPHASLVNRSFVEHCHDAGLSVRPWGVSNEEIMMRLYDCGVDGMTVNFPDKLYQYICCNSVSV